MELIRGSIVVVNFKDINGAVQGKHMAVIISNNKNNQYSNLVQVVPITSSKKGNIPTHVMLERDSLNKVCWVLCEQIRTANKEDIEDYTVDFLSKAELIRIESACLFQIGALTFNQLQLHKRFSYLLKEVEDLQKLENKDTYLKIELSSKKAELQKIIRENNELGRWLDAKVS